MTPNPNAPAIDIDAMTTALVLEHAVMGHVLKWVHNPPDTDEKDCWLLPSGLIHSGDAPVSRSRNAFISLVEPEIKRLGLFDKYQDALFDEVHKREYAFYTLLTASAEQRCRAILQVVFS